MPNLPPLEAEQYYHIYNRGNNGETLFREERNYRYFLNLYAKYIEPVAETFAYCLLKNHFHFLVHVKDWRSGGEGFPARQPSSPGRAFASLFGT